MVNRKEIKMQTKNIIVRMRGGLGNQLFQLAYGLFLKKKYGAQNIILDIGEFDYYHVREFELKHFNLGEIIISKHIKSYKYSISRNVYHLLQGIKRKISNKELDLYPFFTKMGLFYSGINPGKNLYSNNKKNIYVYGYFQDITYANIVKNEILHFIDIPDPLRIHYQKSRLPETEYIAISIRCGQDYRQAGYHICDANYYQRALRYIISQRKDQKFHIRVFTDDIIQAQKILDVNDLFNIEYVKNASPVQQMVIMMDCDHFVISNSSFSWWGAYLSKNSNKIVVAPEKWFPSPLLDTRETRLVYKNMVIL